MSELKRITIVLVAYKSAEKIKRFIKKIPKTAPIIIVDNSKDYSLKQVFKKNKNVKIFFKKNQGYGSSINYSVRKIKTPYFLVVQPDVIGINEKALINFYKYAKKLKDKFAVLGPHFKNASKSGHYQTNLKYKIKKIHNVHGSTIFFNKKIFIKNNGFDDNIFLYWEETDYTKRAFEKGYPTYQLNLVKVKHERGKAVGLKGKEQKKNLEHLYIWHFIWSKYYFFKKHYGALSAITYFIPTIIRIFFRIYFHKIKKDEKYVKYQCRWDGLKNSILNNKSSMRLEEISKI